jgi:hypothetical protein
MEPWLKAELRIRRDDVLGNARRAGIVSRAARERSTGIRVRIANGAQTLSDVLAALARTLRNGETA